MSVLGTHESEIERFGSFFDLDYVIDTPFEVRVFWFGLFV